MTQRWRPARRLLTLLVVALVATSTPAHAMRSTPQLAGLKLASGGRAQVHADTADLEQAEHGGGADHGATLEPTSSGYLDVNHSLGTKMFYAFFEAQEAQGDVASTPIILWLQGGPGCSSFFGMLYINGPYLINEDTLSLRHNQGSWSRQYGMLFIEQPLGVGFSAAAPEHIPTDELNVARDLFHGLQSFYRTFPHYQDRVLVISGESYAGKYVPSISHYILQMEAMVGGWADQLSHPRSIPAEDVQDPLFSLGGLAVGNGFTDAETQTLVQADVAWSMGLIDSNQKATAEVMQREIVDLIQTRRWRQARYRADELNAFITNASGAFTLEDVRRNRDYDASDSATRFINQVSVKQVLKAPLDMTWISCSPVVDKALAGDVMKSVRHLVIDLLLFKPVLLYQGQWDAECGVASNDAWVNAMPWHGHTGYSNAERTLWRVNGRVAGFVKEHQNLRNVVIRNTGHMTPHDNPLYSQLMIERWIEEAVMSSEPGTYSREEHITIALEKSMQTQDAGENANPAEWK